MGSQSKIQNLAYIAGFLDGDGCLMLQVKRRKDTKRKWRFMFTICFYQDSRHDRPLYWIQKELGIGYISKRNDGITELRVNGYKQVKNILEKLIPFIRFKKVQASTILKAVALLEKKPVQKLTLSKKLRLVKYLLAVQNENYQSPKKKTKEDLIKILDLTP